MDGPPRGVVDARHALARDGHRCGLRVAARKAGGPRLPRVWVLLLLHADVLAGDDHGPLVRPRTRRDPAVPAERRVLSAGTRGSSGSGTRRRRPPGTPRAHADPGPSRRN